MKIAIASEHAGYNLKERLVEYLRSKGFDVDDLGAQSDEAIDYPFIALELAEKVILNDNIVDDLYEQIFRELLTYMLEDPRSISRAIKLIFIANHLERGGDHSANISEMVVFMVRGQDIRHATRLDRGR